MESVSTSKSGTGSGAPASSPPEEMIRRAERAAMHSPCAKSRRGVVLYGEIATMGVEYAVAGVGHNGPPRTHPGTPRCDGSARCHEVCNRRCVHAEMRALRDVAPGYQAMGGLHLLHVKLGPDDRVVGGHGPSCWQCSREILDVGFVAGVWLYESRVAVGRPDDRERHDHETVESAWYYYSAQEFHRETARTCDLDMSSRGTES